MKTSSTFVATDGDNYELTMGRWSQRLAPLFLDFVGLEGVESLLDVGCGTGHLAAAASRRLPSAEVCAVDLSSVYIEHAKLDILTRGSPSVWTMLAP